MDLKLITNFDVRRLAHMSLILPLVFQTLPGYSQTTMPSSFTGYPPEKALTGRAVAPKLNSPQARHYRTILKAEAQNAPNFNGHFRVASWGCGTNCLGWAIVDLQTGDVWFPPDLSISCPGQDSGASPHWLEHFPGSRLLWVHSFEPFNWERTFTTRTVYEWRDGALHLLTTEPLP